MSYDEKTRQKALHLRSLGYSFHEIASSLTIPRGTIYTWTKNLQLNNKALARINSRREFGRQNATITRQEKAIKQQQLHQKQINQAFRTSLTNTSVHKIIAACLYWAEGSKNQNSLIFTNSDPAMISLFLTTLRNSFSIDESKFRVLVHLHPYHNPEEMLKFWSRATNVPISQFLKPYLKPHTGNRKHKDYHGCCSIRYYDANLAKLLTASYRYLTRIENKS